MTGMISLREPFLCTSARKFVSMVALNLAAALVYPASAQVKGPRVIQFKAAGVNDAVLRKDYRHAEFHFLIDGDEYTVSETGDLSIKTKQGAARTVRLDFPDPPLMTSIYYCVYDHDLLITYYFLLDALIQTPDGKNVKGKIEQARTMRLNRRGLKRKWVVINGGLSDSPGVPVLADDSLYLTTVGFIAEVDLRKGYGLWQHDYVGRPDNHRPIIFAVPRVTDQYVFFDEAEIGQSRPLYTVQVRRGTGEIIQIKPISKSPQH